MDIQLKPNFHVFKEEVARRNISRLTHFTTIGNLFSIFEQRSLLSRGYLKKLNISKPDLYLPDYLQVNDRRRLDNLGDYLNLSIQFPNYYLFKKFRESSLDCYGDWCIIAIKLECIWFSETLFSVGNAASRIAKEQGISGSFQAFKALFSDEVESGSMYSRRVLGRDGLADCYPTDVQAEVLVKGCISIEYFFEVYFETKEVANRSKGAILTVMPEMKLPPFVVNPSMYEGVRRDG